MTVHVAKKNFIGLDWDVEYEGIERTEYYGRLIRWIEVNEEHVKEVWMRRSPNGRVHVRIWLDGHYGMLGLLVARAELHDDPNRIANDLRRLGKRQTGVYFTDVLFDMKLTLTNLMPPARAGEWHKIWPTS